MPVQAKGRPHVPNVPRARVVQPFSLLHRLQGRPVRVSLFSGLEIAGRLEEVGKFELGLLLPAGQRLVVMKNAVLTVEAADRAVGP